MVRFSDTQYAEFLMMYEQADIHSKVRFILARIFGEKKALAMLYKLEQENDRIVENRARSIAVMRAV